MRNCASRVMYIHIKETKWLQLINFPRARPQGIAHAWSTELIVINYFTVCISLIYTVYYFYVFPVLRKYRLHKNTYQCKNLSLYLKKAGLASRNMVHLQKTILRCVGFLLLYSSPPQTTQPTPPTRDSIYRKSCCTTNIRSIAKRHRYVQ